MQEQHSNTLLELREEVRAQDLPPRSDTPPQWAEHLSTHLQALQRQVDELGRAQTALGRELAAACTRVDRVEAASRLAASELRTCTDRLLGESRALRARLQALEE